MLNWLADRGPAFLVECAAALLVLALVALAIYRRHSASRDSSSEGQQDTPEPRPHKGPLPTAHRWRPWGG